MNTVVALVQNEELRQHLLDLAHDMEIDLVWELEVRGVVKTIADMRPLMMLVELRHDEPTWPDIVWALKTNPATRRLAIIGCAKVLDDALYEKALSLRFDDVFEQWHGLEDRILGYARRSDAELQTALATACQQPLPPLVHQGLQEFNIGDYYEAHETIEHAWVDEPGLIRNLYRGILQVAVAYYHIQRGNYHGALKMFLRSLQWLEPLPDECQGIQVAQLRRDSRRARQTLERLGPEGLSAFDMTLLKPVQYDENNVRDI